MSEQELAAPFGVYEPAGVRFYDPESGREMLYITQRERREEWRGWLCFRPQRGADWIALRKANNAERIAIMQGLGMHAEMKPGRDIFAELELVKLWQASPKRLIPLPAAGDFPSIASEPERQPYSSHVRTKAHRLVMTLGPMLGAIESESADPEHTRILSEARDLAHRIGCGVALSMRAQA